MKKQIGVIFGSRSCEREVAIISAVQLMRHMDREKYDVIPVYIDENGNWYTGEKLTDINAFKPFRAESSGVIKVFPDLSSGSGALLTIRKGNGLFGREKIEMVARIDVYVVVMHGLNGEDGTLQGLLELANVPYTSTGVAGSALGMDKIMMKQFFRGADLPVLPGLWFTRSEYEQDCKAVTGRVKAEIGFPVFVKPANLGSSIGVSRADDPDTLKDSLELAFEYDRRVLVEKGLDKPIELNCSVAGYDQHIEASPIEMPINNDEFLDFRDKYLSSGGSKGMASLHRILPAPIEEELKDRFKKFSVRIIRLVDNMPNTLSGRAIASQIVRSGTSPAANYRAACIGKSGKDFLNKLKMVEEELDETSHWLEVIMETNMLTESRVKDLHEESIALLKIIVSSIVSTRKYLSSNSEIVK